MATQAWARRGPDSHLLSKEKTLSKTCRLSTNLARLRLLQSSRTEVQNISGKQYPESSETWQQQQTKSGAL